MKFTKEKIIGLVGAVVGLVGMFLPFITRSVYSILKVDLKYMNEFSPDNIIFIGFGGIYDRLRKDKKRIW